MQMNFFWVPAADSAPAEIEVNRFLAAHRVVHVEKAFCGASPSQAPGWALCVQWLHGSEETGGNKSELKVGKVDYREVLDAPTFAIFSALRSWRKEVATTQGVPIYTVATNEQLAAISQQRIRTAAELEKIDGFGASRMARFAVDLLAVCARELDKPDGIIASSA